MNNKIRGCAKCMQLIAFAKTNTGNSIPVNVSTLSNEEIAKYNSGEEISFRFGKHISHFATCPEASTFRKVKK